LAEIGEATSAGVVAWLSRAADPESIARVCLALFPAGSGSGAGAEPARLVVLDQGLLTGWGGAMSRSRRLPPSGPPSSAAVAALAARSARGGSAALEPDGLTKRELEVLEHLARGLSNRAIGEALGISEHTAKFHVVSILGKLGVQGRTE